MKSSWGPIPSAIIRSNSRVYTGKVKSPNMRNLTDPTTGKQYQVPDDDYRQYYGVQQDKSIEKYVAAAFDGTSKIEVQEVGNMSDAVGHILKLEYSVMYMILRVTFRNKGSVVAYMKVPTGVAGELLSLARSNATQLRSVDGKLRHVLGMRFWDLVRIRGTIHGTRYKFEYVTDMSNSTGSTSNVTANVAKDVGDREFVMTKQGSQYVGKSLDQLSDNEKKLYEDRLAVVNNRGDKESPFTIDNMYRFVNRANIEDSQRKSILSKMDAIKQGKGTESDRSKTMYNYLYIMGLL